MEKLYLFCCFCGNIKKLETAKTRMIIEEENELLREDYHKGKSFMHFNFYSFKLVKNSLVKWKIDSQ